MAKRRFTTQVISQDGVLYYGECDVLFVPGEHDTVAVMAYHEPMLMRLAAGKVMVREGHNTNQVAEIQHGIMYVGDNEVSVLVAKHGSVKEAITE